MRVAAIILLVFGLGLAIFGGFTVLNIAGRAAEQASSGVPEGETQAIESSLPVYGGIGVLGAVMVGSGFVLFAASKRKSKTPPHS